MEVPNLVLNDPQLAARVTEILSPLVITPEKKARMVKVLEEELDLGHQYGLDGEDMLMYSYNWTVVGT